MSEAKKSAVKYPDDLMGLTREEYDRVLEIMGREPNQVELGIFSVMWSEHCSYKSSKKWLKTLPTKAPWVIQGPGENAGVIDIGDGLAAIFKMESHNHPSFIEPYQGAATGVGGILRDVFTMGARPVANLNALRFGSPDHPKTRHLVSGVVHGIGGYGNCVGVPTVAGEVNFHPSYNGNILVNAMTVGLAKKDKIFYSAAAGLGNPVVYVGSKTGRDGIHGATMASAEFTDDSEEKRPTVQVGDPFTEKLLIEACLELMATDAIVAIQDMGAAGLTSSSFEMASKGGMGIEIDLDKVPAREAGMTPFEFMLSESQERMLMVLKPGSEKLAEDIFRKWELDFAVIGHLTDTGRMVLRFKGEKVGDLPIDPLAQASPEYDRPWVKTPPQKPLGKVNHPLPLTEALLKIVGSPDMCSRRWIWEQYDYLVRSNTLEGPGGDAAIIRVKETGTSIAMALDGNERYCYLSPREGAKLIIAECCRNLSTVGAQPVATTNNLNFGNPERPEIMAQLVEAIEGMAEACSFFETPITGGNVSLYNETLGEGIHPTPVVGIVGLLKTMKPAGIGFKAPGRSIVLLGGLGSCDLTHFGGTQYAKVVLKQLWGMPPVLDMDYEKRVQAAIRDVVRQGLADAAHDLSDGGLAVALAECGFPHGVGAEIDLDSDLRPEFLLYHEGPSRILVSAEDAGPILSVAASQGVEALVIGRTIPGRIVVKNRGRALLDCGIDDLRTRWNTALETLLRA